MMVKPIRATLLALAFVATEGFAQFCPGLPPWIFDDVPSTHPFCTDITWMAQRGVTLGCSILDPNHRLYCPDENVSRDQMAAFMHRLGDALFPLTCAAGQVMKWNGLAWECANDSLGGAGGGGTVTSVAAGTGLSAVPNPIVDAGVLSVAPNYRLPQACAPNQIAKWNGAAWTCAADVAGSGTVTSLIAGAGIALAPNPIVGAGTVAADTSYLQRRVSQSCIAGSSIRAIAADGTVTCEVDSGTNAFVQNGNTFNAAATLGTTDDFAVRIVANGRRVMRYEPDAVSPNLIGGHPDNSVTADVQGATIGGGGAVGVAHQVTDHYGTVGGGYANRAGKAGGSLFDGSFATVSGGRENFASGAYSLVGGGASNEASGTFASVVGGEFNIAAGSDASVGGGISNVATGLRSTIPGGHDNEAAGAYSFAAGRQAKALGDGSFSFADSNPHDFSSNTPNAFRVRATGGVRFVVEINADGSQAQWCLLNSATGGWSCVSDRNAKQDLIALDGRVVLEKLATMPIYAWSPIGRTAHVRHYGPMAQDFHAAFKLGDSDTMIGTQDADGVALAAIQGLNAKVEAQLNVRDAIIDAQAREIAALRRAVEGMLARLAPDGTLARIP